MFCSQAFEKSRSENQHLAQKFLVSGHVYKQVSKLNMVLNRFVQSFSKTLSQFSFDTVDARFGEVVVLTLKEYSKSIEMTPHQCFLFSCYDVGQDKRGQGLVILDAPLIYSLIQMLLGGGGFSHENVSDKSYTSIEQKLMERVIGLLLTDLHKALELDTPYFPFERVEFLPNRIPFEKERTQFFIFNITLSLNGKRGKIALLLPPFEIYVDSPDGGDSCWKNHLADELRHSDVTLQVSLPQESLKLRNVLSWRVGSRIILKSSFETPVDVLCGQQRVFSGSVGQKGGHVAIKIEKSFLNPEGIKV